MQKRNYKICFAIILAFILSGKVCLSADTPIRNYEERIKMFEYNPGDPPDIKYISRTKKDDAWVHDITFASPKGGRVTAFLVTPTTEGRHPAFIFAHPGGSNRRDFLNEALLFAKAGAVSLLIDDPSARPEPWRRQIFDFNDPEQAREGFIQTIIDLRRCVDLLVERSDVDPQKIGFVGFCFGATQGGILCGIERRISAYALMAGGLRLSEFWKDRITGQPRLDEYIQATEPFNVGYYIVHSAPAAVLYQFGTEDRNVPKEKALEFYKTGPIPKDIKWYNSGHNLNIEATYQRIEWFHEKLGTKLLVKGPITGTWTGTVDGPDGNPLEVTYVFDAIGNMLLGTVNTRLGGGPFEEGKIDGNKISFVSRPGPSTIIEMTGTLSGDVINMTQKKGDDVKKFTLERAAQPIPYMVATVNTTSDTINCVLKQYVRHDYPKSSLPDPSEPGRYKVKTLTYGGEPLASISSTLDIVTPTVKLPDFLADWSRKVNINMSNAYHNFDYSKLPLKARVSFPEGAGPFPIILIVHGNDPNLPFGFKYLADLLASRGYIAAQVDETFLYKNNGWGEVGARGWLLLNHLELWRKWNKDKGSIFYNKVDLEKIALIGMSRGGEAVTHAATFNQWDNMPKTNEALDFNFSIKAVIALAPADGQYKYEHSSNILNNVNYMILQGGHDTDVAQYLGSRQWLRTWFDDGNRHIKAELYFYRANHWNFNQSLSVNVGKDIRKEFDARLITPKQQENLTKFYVSALLEGSLFNKIEYFELIKHPPVPPGCPEDIYISRYMESNYIVIAGFESGKSNTSIFRKSGDKFIEESYTKIRTERLRSGFEIDNNVLEINLSPEDSETHVMVKLPKSFLKGLRDKKQIRFFFSIARAEADESGDCDPYNLFDETTLSVLKGSVPLVSKPLGNIGSVSPLLLSDYSPLPLDPRTEPVLQTFEVPVESGAWVELIGDNEPLMLDLIFTPSRSLKIIIDDVGFVEQ